MGIMDKFLKNKKTKSSDEEFDDLDGTLDDNFDDDEDDNFDDNFESDIDIDESDVGSEFKEQKTNFKSMIEKNKKIAIGVGVVAGLGVAGIVGEPFIMSMMNNNKVMDNKEFEQTSKQVKELSESSVKESNAIAEAKKQEREERIEKLKALKIQEESKINSNGNNPSNNNSNTRTLGSNNNDLEVPRSNVNIQRDRDLNNPINSNVNSDINVEKTNKIIVDSIVNEKGHINQKSAEVKMDTNFKLVTSKIENTQLMHEPSDEMDPFLQEYDGTVNSRAMRSELTENMKLMKDYIEFLDTKKKFEEAKLVYEKKKQKGLFAEEISKVKADFLQELEGMKQSMSDLRAMNSQMANKLVNDKKRIEEQEIKKANDELSARKMRMSSGGIQKVYRIGSSYILEETEEDGNTKIYRDGSSYKNAIIVQITPEFIKVKEANGDNIILTINTGSEVSGSYSTITIATPAKSIVENDSNAKTGGTEVKDYSSVKAQEKAAIIDAKEASAKSRFLK